MVKKNKSSKQRVSKNVSNTVRMRSKNGIR